MSLLTRTTTSRTTTARPTVPAQRSAASIETAPARPAGAPAPEGTHSRRRYAVLAAGGLAVAGLVAGGVVVLDDDGSSAAPASPGTTTEWVPAFPGGDPGLGAPAGGWVPADAAPEVPAPEAPAAKAGDPATDTLSPPLDRAQRLP